MPYLELFHQKYPNVKIGITNNPTPQTLKLLKQGKIDFATVSEPFSGTAFEVFPIRKIKDIFICNPERKIPPNVSITDIKDELILLERNTSTRTFLDNEFRKRGFYAAPKFELATSPQIISFTVRNMGIGCVVSDFARQEISLGKVKEIKISDPLSPRHICIIHNNDVRSIAADKFLEMIK